jgi:putative two-component system response regulator
MQRHTVIGHGMLSDSASPLLQLGASIALTHHERWDGNGYPNGLAGEDIPPEGRVTAIADVYDALTSDRVYRLALSRIDALAHMRSGRGTHFDPDLLDLFIDTIDQIRPPGSDPAS